MPPADENHERLRPSLEGRKFSRYEILEPIGGGGMGEVYKARDLQLGRFVAVKTLRPDDGDSPENGRRLAREARFAASLDHPFICKVHDLIQLDSGETLVVMEYVEGRALGTALEKCLESQPDAGPEILSDVRVRLGQARAQPASGTGLAPLVGEPACGDQRIFL